MLKIALTGLKGLPSKGGVERVGEAIVQALKEQYEFTVYCSKFYTPEDTRYPGMKLIRLPCFAGKHLHPVTLNLFAALHALFFGNYDLVHIHNAEACFVAPLLRLKFRVIATSHGQGYDRDKWNPIAKLLIKLLDFFFINFANRLTSVSLPDAENYKEKWNRKVQYLPNGVDDELAVDIESGRSILSRHGVTGEFILFAAGRMDRTKGCHFLLEAFAGTDTDLNLVIIGDNDTDRAYIESLKTTRDKRVKFIPFIAKKSEFLGIMGQAKFFVFPSTYEAMSIVLLEAASLGVPVVASDIPANTAILPEHVLYFHSADTKDLEKKLKWALAHPEAMKEQGKSSRQWVRESFSWQKISERYAELYQSLR